MPGRELPTFLRDFIAMRQQLHKTQGLAQTQPLVGHLPVAKPGAASKGTSLGIKDDLSEMSVAKIVEEKPPAKELIGYFQKMCDRLTQQKMNA